MDQAFTALADDTRRRLLDRLHERDGQTLGELCAHIDMARQSVTQHLPVLEAAQRSPRCGGGRGEKLHWLDPVPLHEMRERWIDKFDRAACWSPPRSSPPRWSRLPDLDLPELRPDRLGLRRHHHPRHPGPRLRPDPARHRDTCTAQVRS
ncbi:hypothetical protein B6E66_38850 [Streptomyces maremycinicus]|nr:hypothetical protein B6E66_38850 [Streptomyces sp. B9173]